MRQWGLVSALQISPLKVTSYKSNWGLISAQASILAGSLRHRTMANLIVADIQWTCPSGQVLCLSKLTYLILIAAPLFTFKKGLFGAQMS